MSTNVLNADLNQSINPLLADLGATLVFGLGFYFFKGHFKKKKDEKEMKDKLKPLREKIEETINKWESSICLQKLNSIIKNEITESNFDPFTVLDQLRNKNITPDISTINTLLDVSSRLKDFKNFNRLKHLILEDEQALCAPNIVTFNIILKGINLEMSNDKLENESKTEYAKRNINLIITEIEKRGLKPNDITMNTIIDITVEGGCFELAWKYYDDMEKIYSVEPDIYTYSTLLKTIKNYEPDEILIERAFEILKIVKLSKAKGIKPDEILYNCILDTCVKYNRMEQAETIFRDMFNAGINPSKITYAIMIKGYGNDYQLEKALDIFNEMKLNNVAPNEIIYGCLLNACVKCNKIEKACEVYDEIKMSSIEMNLFLYTTLIKGYTKTKNFDKAIEIYYKLLDDKLISANIIAYNAILDSCVECGDYDMMNKIYEDIKTNAINNENAPQPDLITYSTVIKGYSRMKNVEKVMDIYNFLRARDDMVLDEVIYNSILDGLLKSMKYEEALKVYDDMRKNGLSRSNATFSILIKIYSKMDNVDKAVEVYNEMKAEKMKPSLITYTSIIQILIKTKRIQNAIDIFDEILKLKLNPDQVMFNVIINGCVFNGRLDDACKFLFESFKANIRLCIDVYKNVLNNLYTNRIMETNYKNDITLRVCKELKTRGLKIDYDLYYKVMKMIYKFSGKNSDRLIQKELDDYKNSVNNDDNSSYDSKSNFYKSSCNDQKPRNRANYNNLDGYNGNKNYNSNGNANGKWRK